MPRRNSSARWRVGRARLGRLTRNVREDASVVADDSARPPEPLIERHARRTELGQLPSPIDRSRKRLRDVAVG